MKVLFDSENCYEAKVIEGDYYVIDDYSSLTENEEIDQSTIEWSQLIYDEERNYFHQYLQEVIQAYEKRYKTFVYAIAIAGRVGLWNGSPIGGRFINSDQNPLNYMGDVDAIDVKVDEEDGEIYLYGHHHDGTHIMQIYLMTENKLRKIAPDYLCYGESNYCHFERIYEECKPLKFCNVAKEYYGNLKKKGA